MVSLRFFGSLIVDTPLTMPNNKYERSVKRERQLVNEARAKGNLSARSAGSKSKVDVWEVDHRDKVVHCIQVKTHKGGRFLVKKDTDVYEGYTVIFSTYTWG